MYLNVQFDFLKDTPGHVPAWLVIDSIIIIAVNLVFFAVGRWLVISAAVLEDGGLGGQCFKLVGLLILWVW